MPNRRTSLEPSHAEHLALLFIRTFFGLACLAIIVGYSL
jgi:hypothetical protein